MLIENLEKFIKECHEKGVAIPSDLHIALDAWDTSVPEDRQHFDEIEYNIRISDQVGAKVMISPKQKNTTYKYDDSN